jgi:hypothetical protein
MGERQTMFRVQKDKNNPYVMLNKELLNDTRLSWKAKGILAYLLSLPDDWKIYEKELAKHSKDGKESLRTGIQELIKAGYIVRTLARDKDGKLRGYEYKVLEKPTAIRKTDVGKTDVGKSDIGKSAPTNNDSTDNDSTKKRRTKKERYIVLPDDIPFISIYKNAYKRYLGADHPPVRESQLQEIIETVKQIEENSIDEELWREEVELHFQNLPLSNDGKIFAFLAVWRKMLKLQKEEETSRER